MVFKDINIILKAVKKFNTPLYLYFYNKIIENLENYKKKFPKNTLFCYALKANSNLKLCEIIANNGFGADVVSGWELRSAILSGFRKNKIVFSGVGKTKEELDYAVNSNILFINVESFDELRCLGEIAKKKNIKTNFSIRINPDVDPHTHKYISTGKEGTKFGVSFREALEMYKFGARHKFLIPKAIHFHLGSQIFDSKPYKIALDKILNFLNILRKEGIRLKYIDIGGGWGIKEGENLKGLDKLANIIKNYIKDYKFIIEPGRSVIASTGILLVKVLYIKKSGAIHIVVVDGGMNDFIRPALYNTIHPIVNLNQTVPGTRKGRVDIVGPVCESGDFFAKNIKLKGLDRLTDGKVPGRGDILAIISAGAYGYSMASNYNLRPKPAEVLIKGKSIKLIRKRQDYSSIR